VRHLASSSGPAATGAERQGEHEHAHRDHHEHQSFPAVELAPEHDEQDREQPEQSVAEGLTGLA